MSDSSALLRRRNAGAFKQLAARYLRLRERKKVGIDLVLLRRAHTVWRALVDLQLRVLDQLDGQQGGVGDRNDWTTPIPSGPIRILAFVEAWKYILQRQHEPVALILTRQAVPTLDRTKLAPASGLRRGP